MNLFLRYLSDRKGNFSIILVVCSACLLISISVAVDFARISSANTKLKDVTDAAMLAGARAIEDGFENNKRNLEKLGRDTAIKFFTDQKGSEFESAKLDPDYSITGIEITGNGTFHHTLPSVFSGVLGNDHGISGTSSVVMNLKNYVNITLLVDASGSMGIGASIQDQQRLYDLRPKDGGVGCAFACHLPKNSIENEWTVDTAKGVNATLRIDVVREAVRNVITELSQSVEPNQVRVSIYTFSVHLEEVLPFTTDLNSAISAADTLDLHKLSGSQSTELGGTYIRNAMNTLSEDLKTKLSIGTGKSENSRSSYVILFSDGIENSGYSTHNNTFFSDGHPIFQASPSASTKAEFVFEPTFLPDAVGSRKGLQIFNPNACNSLKKSGHEVYTAQVKYTTNDDMKKYWWNTAKVEYIGLDNTQNMLDTAFQRCASQRSNYVKAETSAEIYDSLNSVFDDIIVREDLRISK